ncbi:MAG: hypothetical protein HKO62_09265 [Gammaproteobacteria bacterium]|nr:hypothetical protein [Gammaproteobacteria bacterium]
MTRLSDLFHAVLLIAALYSPLPATAAWVAAEAGVYTVTCTPTTCGGPGAVSDFDGSGGNGATSAFASLSSALSGSGRGRAQIIGSAIALPSLGAEAFPTSGGLVAADAGAMKKYIYQGPDNSLFDLKLSVDGSVGAAQPDQAALVANAAVILASSLDFAVDPGAFIGENVALDPNAMLVTEAYIDFSEAPSLFNLGQQTRDTTLSFSLDNGDEVFIWASLRVRGDRGAFSDAYSSLELVFTSGNVADLTAVPLPAPVVLLGSALGTLALWRRRRATE